MSSFKPRIFYFRSLNTGGGDVIQLGPLRLGSFSKHYEREFRHSSLDFVPVEGMGTGSLWDQAKRAKNFLDKMNFWSLPPRTLHFYGHSAGGLVAKLIAADPVYQNHLKSLITIGTPHGSCSIAQGAVDFPTTHPGWSRFCRWLGYDFSKKQNTFESFQVMEEQDFHFPPSLVTGSVVCAPPPEKWSRLLRLARLFPLLNEVKNPSDGLIPKDAQIFGTYQWEFELDHVQQIGFGGHTQEFKRLCRFLEETWATLTQEGDLKPLQT